jgi:hypothetical protein
VPTAATEIQVQIQLSDDTDTLELDELTSNLRRELLDLDVDAVERVAGEPPPPGAKAIDAVVVGALIIKLAKSGAIPAIAGALHRWLGANANRSIRIEMNGEVLEAKGISNESQDRVLAGWMESHATR